MTLIPELKKGGNSNREQECRGSVRWLHARCERWLICQYYKCQVISMHEVRQSVAARRQLAWLAVTRWLRETCVAERKELAEGLDEECHWHFATSSRFDGRPELMT